ncbi:hypothetical protein B566_EDAN017111 [Ephemera danica]|nr:hypothetical protein B566_EDAN017111 [Ephemera danica]
MTKKVERKPPTAKSVKDAAEEKVKKNEPPAAADVMKSRLFVSVGIVFIAVGIYFLRVRVTVPTNTSSENSSSEESPEIKFTEHEINLKKDSRNFTIPYPYDGEEMHMCYINVYLGEQEIEVLDYEVQKDSMLVKMKKKLQAKKKYDVKMGCAPYEGELPEVKRDTKTEYTSEEQKEYLFIETCRKGDTELAKKMVKRDTKTEYTSEEQKEYLFIETCRKGDTELAKKMLDEGIDVDTKSGSWMGHTALHWASKNGDIDMIKLLLDHGAQMEIRSEEEVDALQYATFGGHIDAIELLLDRGADIHSRDATDGSTPLHQKEYLFIETCRKGDTELAKKMLDEGIDVDTKSGSWMGHTALHWASKNGDIDMIKVAVYLLKRGADIEKRTDKGDTPLHKAAWWGSLETVKLLLDRDANINAKNNEGETPLRLARDLDRTEVIKYLELRGGRA